MKDLELNSYEVPLDRRGNPMQLPPGESVEQITLATTAQKREVAVPPDALTVTIYPYNSDGTTATSVKYGGARAGAPATFAPVASGKTASVVAAPAIYLQAQTAGDLITLVWGRKEIV